MLFVKSVSSSHSPAMGTDFMTCLCCRGWVHHLWPSSSSILPQSRARSQPCRKSLEPWAWHGRSPSAPSPWWWRRWCKLLGRRSTEQRTMARRITWSPIYSLSYRTTISGNRFLAPASLKLCYMIEFNSYILTYCKLFPLWMRGGEYIPILDIDKSNFNFSLYVPVSIAEPLWISCSLSD